MEYVRILNITGMNTMQMGNRLGTGAGDVLRSRLRWLEHVESKSEEY